MIRELSDDLITRAANGEEKALERILEIFDPYITAVSSFDRVTLDRKVVRELDEDMKIQIHSSIGGKIHMFVIEYLKRKESWNRI